MRLPVAGIEQITNGEPPDAGTRRSNPSAE
jgi:hypothetical protein